MTRKAIKTVSNEPEEFIPEKMRELTNDGTLEQTPMIFVGKRTNRDQQWLLQDMIELKDSKDPDKGIKNMGVAFKYMWQNLIIEVKNVLAVGDSFKGAEKDALWDTSQGMDDEITEAITHFYTRSKLDEDEVKTSDTVQDSITS